VLPTVAFPAGESFFIMSPNGLLVLMVAVLDVGVAAGLDVT